MTIDEVAQRLRASTMTVFRLMKSGKLPFIKVSRRFTRIRAKDLENFLDKHTHGKGETK